MESTFFGNDKYSKANSPPVPRPLKVIQTPGWQRALMEKDSDSDDWSGTGNLESTLTETIDELIARLKATNVPAQNPAHPRPSDDSVKEYYQWLIDIGVQNTAERCLLTALTTKYAKKNLGSLRICFKKGWSTRDIYEYIRECTDKKDQDPIASSIAFIDIEKNQQNPNFRHAYVKWKNEDIILAGKAYAFLKMTHDAASGILRYPKYDNRKLVDWDRSDRPIYLDSLVNKVKRPAPTFTISTLPTASRLENQRLAYRKTLHQLLVSPFENNEIDIDNTSTYGLKPRLITYLALAVPITCVVLVPSPKVREVNKTELLELFSKAGKIVYTVWNTKWTRLQYDHPLEAVQAISMFNMEKIDGYVWEARMGNSNKDLMDTLLPPKFKTFGQGIGPNGAIIRNIRSSNHVAYANTCLTAQIKILNDSITDVTNILDNFTKESQQMDKNSEQKSAQNFQNQIPQSSTGIPSSIHHSFESVTALIQGLIQQDQIPHAIPPNWTNMQHVQAAMPISQAVTTAVAGATISTPKIQPYITNMHTATIQPADISSNIHQSVRPVSPKSVSEIPFSKNQTLVKPVTPVSTNLDRASRFDVPPEVNRIPDLSTFITSSINNSSKCVTPLMQGLMQQVQNPHGLPPPPPNWTNMQLVQEAIPISRAVTTIQPFITNMHTATVQPADISSNNQISIDMPVLRASAATISLPQLSTVPTIQPYIPNMHTATIRPTDISSNIYQSVMPVPPTSVADITLPYKTQTLVKPVTPVSTNRDQPSRFDIPPEAKNPSKSGFNVTPANLKQISQPIVESVPLEALKSKCISQFDIPPQADSPSEYVSKPDTALKNLTPSSQLVDSASVVAKNIRVTASQPLNLKSQVITGSMYRKGSALKSAFKIINPNLIPMPGASKPPEIKINIPYLQPKHSSSTDLESIPVSNPRRTNDLNSSQLTVNSTTKRDSATMHSRMSPEKRSSPIKKELSPPRKVSKTEENFCKQKYSSSKERDSSYRKEKELSSKEKTSSYRRHKEISSKNRNIYPRKDKEISRKEGKYSQQREIITHKDKYLSSKEKYSSSSKNKDITDERENISRKHKKIFSDERDDSPTRKEKELFSKERNSVGMEVKERDSYSRNVELTRDIKDINASDIYSDLEDFSVEKSLCGRDIEEGSSLLCTEKEPTKLYSTVIFKHLPPNVGTEDLKEKMGEIGTILDVIKTGSGEFMVCFLHIRDAGTCVEMYHQSKVDDQTIEAVLAI